MTLFEIQDLSNSKVKELFDYSSIIKRGTGFRPDIVQMLADETNKLTGYERIVGILQDEVRMEETIEKKSKILAKYVLFVMVRGLANDEISIGSFLNTWSHI